MSENPYDKLITECTWAVIRGITKGTPLHETMHLVFNYMYSYFKALPESAKK